MAVALGGNFLVAVDQFGVVLACGQNDAGQLGLRETPHIDFITEQRGLLGPLEFDFEADEHNAVMVSAGGKHAAFVTRSGSVYTWGHGWHGQLGAGVQREYSLPQPTPQLAYSPLMYGSRATMVACGNTYTLLLTASGHVWGCGSNRHFQIGVQNMDDPLQVTDRDIRVFTRMPPTRFDCGDGDTQIAFIAAGINHSAAVGRTNGLLWTWGRGVGGQLGHGGGGHYCCALVPTHLPRETFGEAVVSVSVCRKITMAVTGSGALWVSGYSTTGNLGLGDVQRCVAFQRVGTADDFGDGGVRSVVCSRWHSLILSYDGSVRACGSHKSGCFHGDNYLVPTLIARVYFKDEPVVLVSASDTHSVAVTKSGRLFTWGFEAPDYFGGLARTLAYGTDGEPFPWLPRQVLRTNIPNQRIQLFGLWLYPFGVDEMLAFAMGKHSRLGTETCYRDAPDEVLQFIWASLMVPGASHFGIGLQNLLGI